MLASQRWLTGQEILKQAKQMQRCVQDVMAKAEQNRQWLCIQSFPVSAKNIFTSSW